MLALIAGTGALPAAIVHALAHRGEGLVICEMQGFKVENLPDTPKISFRIEALGTLLQTLTSASVTQVCFAGAVQRPPIDPSAIDAATLPLVPKMMAAMAQGDDGALRVVIEIFEDAGFDIRAAHDIAPNLLPPAGFLTGTELPDSAKANLGAAMAHHINLSHGDIGQAVVTAGGQVVASEDRAGTDAMLRSLVPKPPPEEASWLAEPLLWPVTAPIAAASYLTDWISGYDGTIADRGAGQGGLLYKAPKIGQDRRVDLPVIGPRTLMLAAEAGLRTIVIEAGGVMIIDQPQVTQIATAMGITIWVREAGS